MESTTHPHAHYTVVLRDGTRIDALPTPRLLDEVGRSWTVEAWQETPGDDRYPPIWRLRDKDYDPEGTEYHEVFMVERKGW